MNICILNVDNAVIKPNQKMSFKIKAKIEPEIMVLSIFLIRGVREGEEGEGRSGADTCSMCLLCVRRFLMGGGGAA